MTGSYDLHFWFDPVCPFAWLTSRWVRTVAEQREYAVDWRPISLRLLNAHVDYDTHFPPEYDPSHTAGLRLLRVVHRVREEHGRDAVGPLHDALGTRVFDRTPQEAAQDPGGPGRAEFAAAALTDVGLPVSLADAVDDDSRDGPGPEEAGELWDHVVALAAFPGFAELKRSLRETPQLRSFGVEPGQVGAEEDWHGGSRRQRT